MYWLMKCEPEAYSIDDLQREKRCFWEGVRNYQARNFMRDDMRVGDMAFFYHSNAKPSGVAGLMRVVKVGYPDHTAWDPSNSYFDPKTSEDKPTWSMVDVEFVEKFPRIFSIKEMKAVPQLQEMAMLQKGSRLSITPLEEKHFKLLLKLCKGSVTSPSKTQ